MTDAVPAKPAAKPVAKAPVAQPAKIEGTITIAGVVKEKDVIAERTLAEMEAGKKKVAAHAERIAKLAAEEPASVDLVARDNTVVPGFSTPGQPVTTA